MSEHEMLDYSDEANADELASEDSSSKATSKKAVQKDQNDQQIAPVTQQQFHELVTAVQNLSEMVQKPKGSKR